MLSSNLIILPLRRVLNKIIPKNGYRFLSISIFLTGLLLAVISFFNLTPKVITVKQQSTIEISGFKDSASSLVKLVENADKAFNEKLQVFSSELLSSYPGEYYIDTERFMSIKGIETPILMNGDKQVNLDEKIPDAFLAETGAISTFFVRKGDDFIRVSTSLRDKDGDRAIGTLLDRSSPAYNKIINGESYLGPVQLFGQQFLSKYKPILDKDGNVIGVLFLGIDLVTQMD